jgi:Leucine-rich repeat (LRR) protein
MRTLTSIEEVNISDNKLESLPDWIGELTSLKKLDVSGCGLTHLPNRYVNTMIPLFSIIVFNSVSLLVTLNAILDHSSCTFNTILASISMPETQQQYDNRI